MVLAIFFKAKRIESYLAFEIHSCMQHTCYVTCNKVAHDRRTYPTTSGGRKLIAQHFLKTNLSNSG